MRDSQKSLLLHVFAAGSAAVQIGWLAVCNTLAIRLFLAFGVYNSQRLSGKYSLLARRFFYPSRPAQPREAKASLWERKIKHC